jgi:hypothetical protein
VYKDTCSLVDDDPEETVHESETSKKRIVLYGRTVTKMNLSLMDPDLAQLSRLFGGTIVTDQATTKKSWIKPAKLPYKQWATKVAPEEGLIMNCPDAIIRPKFNITYSAKGICLVEIVVTLNAEWQLNEDNTEPQLAAE